MAILLKDTICALGLTSSVRSDAEAHQKFAWSQDLDAEVLGCVEVVVAAGDGFHSRAER